MAVKILTTHIGDTHDMYAEDKLNDLISKGGKITNVVCVPNGHYPKMVYILQDEVISEEK